MKNKKIIKFIMLIVVVLGAGFFIYKSQVSKDTYEIINWDTVYNENSIQLYYADLEDEKLAALNLTYKVQEFIDEEETELDKVMKVMEIVKNIVKYQSVLGNVEGYNGYDILMAKGTVNYASGRDMAIIARDLLNSVGYVSRVGELRNEKDSFANEFKYYVVEYWSDEYEKWIMLDFVDGGYFTKDNEPCSVIDIVNSKFSSLKYIGNSSKKDYLKEKKKMFSSYTIMIDNTLLMENSNSYITYYKNESDICMEYAGSYVPPTLYTTEVDLFELSPNYDAILNDKSAYLIIMKADGQNDAFIVAAYQNSKIIQNYFISMNGSEYERITQYDDVEFVKGTNTISLSLNGEDEVAKIVLKYNPQNKGNSDE